MQNNLKEKEKSCHGTDAELVFFLFLSALSLSQHLNLYKRFPRIKQDFREERGKKCQTENEKCMTYQERSENKRSCLSSSNNKRNGSVMGDVRARVE
jgi:hypothetical protein